MGVRPSERGAFRSRLVWLVLFRTVAASLSLVITLARLLLHPSQELNHADTLSLAVIIIAYVSTVVVGLRLRKGQGGLGDAWVQVVGDVVIATGLVYLSGGSDSPLTFLYSLAVIGASVVLDRRGALWAAAASALCFGALVMGSQLLDGASGGLMPPTRVLFVLGSNSLALGLIAVLSGYLSRQLSATGGALSAREADLQRLGRLQQQILSSMPSGLATCDAQRRVTYVNPAGCGILQVDPTQVAGVEVEALLPGVSVLAPRSPRSELVVGKGAKRRILGLSVTPLEGEPGLCSWSSRTSPSSAGWRMT